MAIGLYQDLAVGVDKSGAETWVHRDLYALDCRIGCPPDDFNLLGQDWGLPPWIPHKLRAAAYGPYIAMLRTNMKYAGALRIDHVMGLMRLYWIPPGMRGDTGAYVTYPFADLLGILALESHRNRCLIVGEDLGTVPNEVRHALGEMGVLTYRLFYFERQQDGHFMPPAWYPRQALVSATTHDLPTLAGYWKGRDIEVRTDLNLFPNEDVRNGQIAGRREDKARLLQCLANEELLPEGVSLNPDDTPELTPPLIRAILRYIARTPSFLALVQAEDMLAQTDQANMPGTVDEHPNWRRRLPLAIEQWDGDRNCAEVGEAMAGERDID
jgi:(1->4)-alpha-D-glucan 1-alpha-D-glucosylmutase